MPVTHSLLLKELMQDDSDVTGQTALPRNRCSLPRRRTWSLIPHSQTTRLFHPKCSSADCAFLSRTTFRAIFLVQ
jgi:hypothetical protein